MSIEFPDNEEDNREWLLLNALRQMLFVAQRAQPSYAEALFLGLQMAPTLFRGDSPLVDAFETESERLYRARAAAQSKARGVQVRPITVLDEQIQEIEKESANALPEQRTILENHLIRLKRTRRRLSNRSDWTETQTIRNDSETIGQGYPLPISAQGKDYKEYQFTPNRTLRVRILHPDPGEWKSGVDLIYESYWLKKVSKSKSSAPSKRPKPVLMVRIAALQYKRWNGTTLTIDRRARTQLARAESSFCELGLCREAKTQKRPYRLPHCAAFLRPTNRKQRSTGGFQVTKAWHIPVCAVTHKTDDHINSKWLSSCSLSQLPFSELFNRSMLGSRWLKSSRLESAYRKSNILSPDDRIIVHAQEYGSNSDFDID